MIIDQEVLRVVLSFRLEHVQSMTLTWNKMSVKKDMRRFKVKFSFIFLHVARVNVDKIVTFWFGGFR